MRLAIRKIDERFSRGDAASLHACDGYTYFMTYFHAPISTTVSEVL